MQKLKLTKLTPHKQTDYWTVCEVEKLFETPFLELVFEAARIHRENFDPREVQLSTLLSIKTGGCPEDCTYCPQSARYNTGVENEALLAKEEIVSKAKLAKAKGATRFCMGAAWRGPKERHMPMLREAIAEVKALGMEVCGTFGILEEGQAEQLKEAGLDYYNHNLDTAPEHYEKIITTRKFDDRINTLGKVRNAGLKVCCGGIIGLNESRKERAGLLASLANLDPHPESVPINQLVKVEGTPLFEAEELDWTEFVRTIAIARILMPTSHVRLSAGRQQMPESMQAMCFMAGANSIFYGEKLLTTSNPDANFDAQLLYKLDMKPEGSELDFATILEQQEQEMVDYVAEHGLQSLETETMHPAHFAGHEVSGGCGSGCGTSMAKQQAQSSDVGYYKAS
ncbi:biotin synthase BioB [Psittacicella gerlachiana]|uniref:Biotin synthase n=1 Tax=Psittacicella gerlachiana TaxID=2028574 RepID=A0A3A1YFU9_9GAMM|nr:biotin synthase BioB [Psittacicella gerlachiana]